MIHETKANYVVLVIDDSPDSLRFLTDALDSAGMTVLVATDGEEALARVNEVRPDVVLLDALMPGLDGFETCRRMKADPRFRDLPVIFMTALSETEHVVEGLAAGGVDYVTKPIIADELIARIHVHGKNARLARTTGLALDAAGRALLAVTGRGSVLWMTPGAEALLAESLPAADGDTPAALPGIAEWLKKQAQSSTVITPPGAESQLIVSLVSAIGPDEFLLAVRREQKVDDKEVLRASFTLTVREAEVLLWIASGKSNRDIGEILGLSPRTVNKHLEQIFAKLGVENRTAAAALALNAIERRKTSPQGRR
jgi:DNA-binding NarL/FixJ family response regulator